MGGDRQEVGVSDCEWLGWLSRRRGSAQLVDGIWACRGGIKQVINDSERLLLLEALDVVLLNREDLIDVVLRVS